MNELMDTDFDADGLSEAPLKLLYIFILIAIIISGLYYSASMVDSQTAEYRQEQFQQGIRRGLKLYATQYDLSNTGLQRLSEGYLMKDDLDGTSGYRSDLSDPDYDLDTNALLVEKNRAKTYFDKMIDDNHYDDKMSSNDYNYYIVNISCTYSLSNEFNTSFAVEILPKGNPSESYTSSSAISTTKGVVSFIEGYGPFKDKGIKLDLANFNDGRSTNGTVKSLKDKLDNNLRVSQFYSRTNPLNLSDSKATVSTLNMYMCIAIDVPIRGIVGQYTKNFCEVQSYTTVRTGEGGVNQK